MTKDEALRLALEAMELVIVDFVCKSAHHAKKDRHVLFEPCPVVERYKQAITAIKEALKTKDEPVAWMFQHEETGRIMFVEAQQLEWGFEKGNPRLEKVGPLYTTPQRTWVGLTEEDLKLLSAEWRIVYGAWMDDFARAIEAKLKEKNHGN